MQKYTMSRMILAAFVVLVSGYGLGKFYSRRPDAREQPIAIPERSHAEAPQTDLPNGWQKIVARAGAKAGRNQQQATLPDGPFGRNVKDLEQLADAGNADAAFALAEGFRECEFFVPPKSDAEMAQSAEDKTLFQLNIVDQVVDQARSAAEKRGEHIDKIPEVPVTSVYQENLRATQERTRECSGVDTKAARNWPEWQKRAAEGGNLEAELTYWHLLLQRGDMLSPAEIVQDKQVAAMALQDALTRGDSRALIAIAEVLEKGMFTEPDPYLAYAYFYAASQAPYADINALPWIGGNFFAMLNAGGNTQLYLRRHMDSTGASLSSPQKSAAQQLGTNLFAQCCQRTGG